MGTRMKDATAAPGPSYRTYIFVWAGLVALTALTVLTANLDFGMLSIVVVLLIASVKSTLVFLWFMHLLYERKTVIKILIPIVIATLAVFIGLTYTDILYR